MVSLGRIAKPRNDVTSCIWDESLHGWLPLVRVREVKTVVVTCFAVSSVFSEAGSFCY